MTNNTALQARLAKAKTAIEKATITVEHWQTNGGFLNPEQSKRFLEDLIKPAVAMKRATVKGMKSHTTDIDRTRFGETVLQGATEGVELAEAERSTLDTNQEQLISELYKAEVRLTDEAIEDNIEDGDIQATIRRLLSKAVSRDAEDAGLNGDIAIAAVTKRDRLLNKQDGLLKRASVQTVDGGGVRINRTLLKRAMKALPEEYRQNRSRMSHWVSSDVIADWADTVANRGTGLGDTVHRQGVATSNTNLAYGNVPVVDIPLIRSDEGGSNDRSSVLLLEDKNAHWGFWRRIKMETDRNISAGVLKIVVSVRMAFNFANPTAVVKIFNLLAAG